jgi:hypothetical protein
MSAHDPTHHMNNSRLKRPIRIGRHAPRDRGLAQAKKVLFQPVWSTCSTNCRIAEAGIAPAFLANSRPCLNTAIKGIALIRSRCARAGNSSVFTFTTTQRPEPSAATFATSGATILHGPHHGAQKSTNTGKADWPVRASNADSLFTSIGSPGELSSVWH